MAELEGREVSSDLWEVGFFWLAHCVHRLPSLREQFDGPEAFQEAATALRTAFQVAFETSLQGPWTAGAADRERAEGREWCHEDPHEEDSSAMSKVRVQQAVLLMFWSIQPAQLLHRRGGLMCVGPAKSLVQVSCQLLAHAHTQPSTQAHSQARTHARMHAHTQTQLHEDKQAMQVHVFVAV